MNYLRRLILISLFLSSIVLANGFNFAIEKDYHQFIDSLDKAPIEVRDELLAKYKINETVIQDSLNVRCVGRWPFGPSWLIEPSDQIETDSLLFLGSGSGIRILKLSNPRIPQMISKIDVLGLMGYGGGIVKKGNLLYVLSANYGLEIYSIANPYQPQKLGGLPIREWCRDIAVKDSFAYVVGWDSMVRVINVANPENCFEVDSLRLPEVTYGIDVQGNYAYVAAQTSGLRIIDISNPVNISEVSSIVGWRALNVLASGNLAYVAAGDAGIRIISIANPLSPQEVGYTTSTPARDLFKISYFVYAVRDYEYSSIFYIVDVGDSSQPTLISSTTASGWGYDVAVLSPFSYGYTADHWEGLHIININDPVNPRVDTALYAAGWSYDIVIDNQKAYIANYLSGLKIVDVSNPVYPSELGTYDVVGPEPGMMTTTAKDSFAYIPYFFLPPVKFISLDVSDPNNPRLAGTADVINPGEDMIIRDSLVYVAEDYYFEIFNVANPRQPRWVGSCNLQNDATSIFLKDTLAYIGSFPSPIINIKNPANPEIIGSIAEGPWGIAVKDTFTYLAINYGGLQIWSVANPSSTYLVDTVYYQRGYDIVINDSFAYFGGLDFRVLNISNPSQSFEIGKYITPGSVRRIFYADGLIYAVCSEAGMVILEQLPPGIEENNRPINAKSIMLKIYPNPAKGVIRVQVPLTFSSSLRSDDSSSCLPHQWGEDRRREIKIFDVSGKLVKVIDKVTSAQEHKQEMNISLKGINPGIYFLQVGKEVKKFLVVR
jgi:hypothetical protein